MTETTAERSALWTMYVGLAASAATFGAALVDHATGNVLAAHIRVGYPGYDKGAIDHAVTVWLIILALVGGLGVASWLVTIWAVKKGKRWAPGLAAGLFATGTMLALSGLMITDTSGEPGLPALLGWTGLAPCTVGFVAVAQLWRGSRCTW